MIVPDTLSSTSPLVISCEHGQLHGNLALLPDARGIVVLAHTLQALDHRDGALAAELNDVGYSTLNADLLTHEEERFPDVQHNVPLLAKRLLAFLGTLHHAVQTGEIPAQPIGLFGTNATTPVVVRIAAQRDHDIAALVCRGGLIDLAGILYLRSLATPILILHTPSETHHTEGNRRALRETHCPRELKIIPETDTQTAALSGTETALRETIAWFVKHLDRLPGPTA